MRHLYMLEAEDLTHLGGPMGTEYTTTIFRQAHRSPEGALNHAERHFGGRIKWLVENDEETSRPIRWDSGDLRYVRYTVTRTEIED